MPDSLSQTLAQLTLVKVRLHCLVCSVIDE